MSKNLKNMEGWILVFATPELYQAKIAEDVLKQHDIVSHILSEPDSVFPALSEAKLYTTPENAEAALMILKVNNLLISEIDL